MCIGPGLFHTIGDTRLLRSVKPVRAVPRWSVAVPAAGHSARVSSPTSLQSVAAAGGDPFALEFVDMTKAEEQELHARLPELAIQVAPAHQAAGPTVTTARVMVTGGEAAAPKGPTPRSNPFADKASRTRV